MQWIVAPEPVDYQASLSFMETRVAAIHAGTADEVALLLEHPPLYTAGTSADIGDLLKPDRFPVHDAGRGGQYTYHGPGQRIVYVMLDLSHRGNDVRQYVRDLEEWIILTLKHFGVDGQRRDGRVGIWVERKNGGEDKIAALGVRVRRWVTFHGIAINICPDLEHFSGIVPCGVTEHGVTSLEEMGIETSMEEVDDALKLAFTDIFGIETDSVESFQP